MSSEAKRDEDQGQPPVALLFCTDLMFAVQLQNMCRAAGFRPVVIRPGTPLQLGNAAILIVDLASRGDWEAAIREATASGIPAVAFGPHTDTSARQRAKGAGASRLLANSNLTRDLPAILNGLKQASGEP